MSVFYMIIFASKICQTFGIWPPPFEINLKQDEIFIIGDESRHNDDDEELIQENELNVYRLNLDQRKFERLHKIVKRFDEQENNVYFKQNQTFLDNINVYDYPKDVEIVQAGFISDKNNLKREEISYNYEELHKEYIDLTENEKKSDKTFNSSSNDEHETVRDAFGKIVDFKSTPRNCTAEELKGFGYGAVKCVWLDLGHADTKQAKINIIYRAKNLFLIWLIIYLIVVLICWCQKGWCCCCCRCKFCHPITQINEAKQYFMNNPPGRYIDSKKQTITFAPSIYEVNAYKKLEKTLMTL